MYSVSKTLSPEVTLASNQIRGIFRFGRRLKTLSSEVTLEVFLTLYSVSTSASNPAIPPTPPSLPPPDFSSVL
ncbi:hypothetical protein L0F63_006355, partial [Massospora cicadina]